MPVIGRGDDDGVDVPVVQHAPEVGDRLRARRDRQPLGQVGLVDVAHGGDVRVGLLDRVAEVGHPLAAGADQGDDDTVVGAADPVVAANAERRERNAAGDHAGRAPLHELTPSESGRLSHRDTGKSKVRGLCPRTSEVSSVVTRASGTFRARRATGGRNRAGAR